MTRLQTYTVMSIEIATGRIVYSNIQAVSIEDAKRWERLYFGFPFFDVQRAWPKLSNSDNKEFNQMKPSERIVKRFYDDYQITIVPPLTRLRHGHSKYSGDAAHWMATDVKGREYTGWDTMTECARYGFELNGSDAHSKNQIEGTGKVSPEQEERLRRYYENGGRLP